MTSPPAAVAVPLNSGAAPTPSRAEQPAIQKTRVAVSLQERALQRNGTRQLAGAHHALEWPGRKDFRALPQVASGKATPPHALASNRYEREGQPRSRSKDTIKGAARKAEGFFCRGAC